MNELNETQQTILAELLQALDQGADIPACLARYPEHAEALRPYLEFRAGLLATEPPAPAAAAYEAGRQTLLGQLANQGVAAGPSSLVHAAGIRWRQLREQVRGNDGGGLRRFDSPLARAGAAGALIFALMGGALGASAAAGFQPAHDVLSALRIVEPDDGDKSAQREEPKDRDGKDGGEDEVGKPEATPTPKLDIGEPKPEATPTPKPDGAEPTAKKPAAEQPREKKPEPTATPKREDRPAATATPRREDRPAPTATPKREPTKTPRPVEPTKTPKPVEPTKTPEPTPTKRPDAPL